MSKLNKATWQQKFSDLINRVSPFTDPLIQKTEHLEVVGTDLGDSVIMGYVTEDDINTPAAAFSTDFNAADQYNIDSTGVGTAAFTITLQNLDGNRTGLLNITKKSNDVFTFANGVIVPSDNTEHQKGITTLKYEIKIIGSSYVVSTSVPTNTLSTLILDIGDWDMDTDSSVTVAHGLSDFESVRLANVQIVNDASSTLSDLIYNGTGILGGFDEPSGGITINGTNVILYRRTSSVFDSASYSSTPFNRGTITILYQP